MSTIGKKIENLLIEKNITQRELAKRIGTTEVTISRYINGQRDPKAENIAKIAEVLGTTTDHLLNVEIAKKQAIESNNVVMLSEKEQKEVESMANEVFNNFEFNAYKIETMMDSETNDKVKAAILDLCKEIKIKNKIKYNPNKNKNK